jgi:hypothetical protein
MKFQKIIFQLILIQLAAFLLNLGFAQAQSLRPSLVDSSRDVLSSQISGEEFLKRTRLEKEKDEFNLDERLYLEDLTRKLPLALREKVCPDSSKGLCQGDLPDEDDWEDVPALPAHSNSAKADTWWGRNSGWVITAAAGVAVASIAYSLRGKEIEISRSR